jgi:hypothetical protein
MIGSCASQPDASSSSSDEAELQMDRQEQTDFFDEGGYHDSSNPVILSLELSNCCGLTTLFMAASWWKESKTESRHVSSCGPVIFGRKGT